MAYWRLCDKCHKTRWGYDGRCVGPHCKPREHVVGRALSADGALRLRAGDLYLLKAPPEVRSSLPAPSRGKKPSASPCSRDEAVVEFWETFLRGGRRVKFAEVPGFAEDPEFPYVYDAGVLGVDSCDSCGGVLCGWRRLLGVKVLFVGDDHQTHPSVMWCAECQRRWSAEGVREFAVASLEGVVTWARHYPGENASVSEASLCIRGLSRAVAVAQHAARLHDVGEPAALPTPEHSEARV